MDMRKAQKIAAVWMAAVIAGTLPSCVWAESGQAAQSEADTKDAVASADEMITPMDIVEDWMVPITADELNDGTYEVEADSSSAMFNIEKAVLTVENGKMSAVLTMGGKGYLKLYMGTAEEAAAGAEEDMIPFVENEEGKHTFEVPVEALDKGLDCAAFSKKKEKWYGRVILFLSTSLPTEAFKERKMTTAEDLALEDGVYTAEALLSGGSGRASIESPAQITVENGAMTMRLVFGSPNYDYVLLNGEKYEPVNTEGNSTFLIPLEGMDFYMPVVADTVAMSQPHEIDYTVYVDSQSLTLQQ